MIPSGDYLMHDVPYELKRKEKILRRKVVKKLLEFDASL